MADDEGTSWEEAIQHALDANAGAEGKPDSLGALARALAVDEDSTQSESSWKTTLRRVRTKNEATEATAVAIAKALQVSRSDLPPASERLTLQVLDGRLQELAELVAAGFEQLGVDIDQIRPGANGRARTEGEGPA